MSNLNLRETVATVIPKGKGVSVLPELMRTGSLLDEAVEMSEKTDLALIGVEQAGDRYYFLGSVNSTNHKDYSVSFTHGKGSDALEELKMKELPSITQAPNLLTQVYNKHLFPALYCDQANVNEALTANIEEVNDYLNFCHKYNIIENVQIEAPSQEEIETIETVLSDITEKSKTQSLFHPETCYPSEVFETFDALIAEKEAQEKMIQQGVPQTIEQEQEQEQGQYITPSM